MCKVRRAVIVSFQFIKTFKVKVATEHPAAKSKSGPGRGRVPVPVPGESHSQREELIRSIWLSLINSRSAPPLLRSVQRLRIRLCSLRDLLENMLRWASERLRPPLLPLLLKFGLPALFHTLPSGLLPPPELLVAEDPPPRPILTPIPERPELPMSALAFAFKPGLPPTDAPTSIPRPSRFERLVSAVIPPLPPIEALASERPCEPPTAVSALMPPLPPIDALTPKPSLVPTSTLIQFSPPIERLSP